MIAKTDTLDYIKLKEAIIELSELKENNKLEIVANLKSIVTEYISNNSAFEELDTKTD